MANARKIILQTKIEGVLTELAPMTAIDNVMMEDGIKKLSEYLAEMKADGATKTELTAAVQTAIDNLVNGAPEALDTLKEIADWIDGHEVEYNNLVQGLASKVEKVDGKDLSSNDFTDALLSKLNAIEAGAQKNTITSVAGKTGAVTLDASDVGLGGFAGLTPATLPVSTAAQTAIDAKVSKVAGKDLSTNDYSDADKAKVDSAARLFVADIAPADLQDGDLFFQTV